MESHSSVPEIEKRGCKYYDNKYKRKKENKKKKKSKENACNFYPAFLQYICLISF